VWLSHVFFDSGFVVQDLETIVEAAPREAIVAIDGYHAFCALPVDLARIHRRAFYLAGGYKYAMAGEGACFLAVPPGTDLRPVDTGWFASFDTLSVAPGAQVPFAADAFRFWGATFDPSGPLSLQRRDGLAGGHRHDPRAGAPSLGGDAEALPRRQRARRRGEARRAFPRAAAGLPRGNFLAFDVDDAEELHRRIAAENITIDRGIAGCGSASASITTRTRCTASSRPSLARCDSPMVKRLAWLFTLAGAAILAGLTFALFSSETRIRIPAITALVTFAAVVLSYLGGIEAGIALNEERNTEKTAPSRCA
jgi:hypothetical protein